jgi:arylsulfatase A-like enzyme
MNITVRCRACRPRASYRLPLLLATLSLNLWAASPAYNVLFLAVDDLRPELGCYGHPMIKSPNIDRLAAQGLRFNRAYCQEALCNPSRASLLTGLRPATLGVFDLATHFRDRKPDVVTLPQLFKKNGYASISLGKIFHTTNGNHDDNESWSEPPWRGPGSQAEDDGPPAPAKTKSGKKAKKVTKADHSNTLPCAAPDCEDDALLDGKIAKQAVAVLNRIKDQPFFLGVGFHKPHLPFVSPKKYWGLYQTKDLKLAPNPFLPKDAPPFASNDASELRRYKGVPAAGPISDEAALNLIHAYYACVSYADAQVGRVLAELDRLGLRQKTLVILWGDHGYHLGEHGTWTKRTNWEIATRAPLIISVPGQKTAGAATEALVEFVDIYPTLAELCQIAPPASLEGKSFRPLLENPRRDWKTAAFSIYPKQIPGVGEGFGRAMRTDRYRLVEWAADASEKRFCELYDHTTDPQENVNLANLPANGQLLRSLVDQLHAGWQRALPPR